MQKHSRSEKSSIQRIRESSSSQASKEECEKEVMTVLNLFSRIFFYTWMIVAYFTIQGFSLKYQADRNRKELTMEMLICICVVVYITTFNKVLDTIYVKRYLRPRFLLALLCSIGMELYMVSQVSKLPYLNEGLPRYEPPFAHEATKNYIVYFLFYFTAIFLTVGSIINALIFVVMIFFYPQHDQAAIGPF